MYNVIMTDNKTNETYYVSSDGKYKLCYHQAEAIKFEFEDYEDARNVALDFISNHRQKYEEGIITVDVWQM